NVVATCKSGVDMGECSKQVIRYEIKYKRELKNGFVEVHIPNNSNSELRLIKNTLPGCISEGDEIEWVHEFYFLFEIVDLWTGKKLELNVDYSVSESNGVVSFLGDFEDKDLFLKINSDFAFLQSMEVTTDYSSWTLYEYDSNQQLIKTISPLGVNCDANITAGTLPVACDYGKETIGITNNDCDVIENAVTLESNTFDNFDTTTHSGEYKFVLNFLSMEKG